MMISYAQAREDIILHRTLHHVLHSEGFYIDVGAYHPTHDSVTKHFYDHGWKGINVEPSRKLISEFILERTRDINLQFAVSDNSTDVTFYEVDGQLGTIESSVAEVHSANGLGMHSYTVPGITLTQICEQHAPRDIHFLKIDVENHETAVLRGMDFKRFRPWILVIEATQPNRLDLPTHHEWEGIVMTAGYSFALMDLPNRYYVANEHLDLMKSLALPVDQYRLAADVWAINSLQMRLDHAMNTIHLLRNEAAVNP